MDTKLTITVSHLNFLDGFWRMIMGIPILTILTAILFTDVAIAANKYLTYESCMFDQMKQQQTETAAKAIQKICKSYPTEEELKRQKAVSKQTKKTETPSQPKPTNDNSKTDYVTIYYQFPYTLTSKLKNSRKMLQLGLGVSTQWDESVIYNLEKNELQIKSAILTTMAELTEKDIQGSLGKMRLAKSILASINNTQIKAFGFGGVDEVLYTSFILY